VGGVNDLEPANGKKQMELVNGKLETGNRE